jgi:hypothetical protein
MTCRSVCLLSGLLIFTCPANLMAESSEEIPKFDPERFFTGHTRSWGAVENWEGNPVQVVTTETWGHLINGRLQLEQDLHVGGKRVQHRSWSLCRIDSHHFEATANDMVGTAKATVNGNTLSWTFVLAIKPGNSLFNIQMTQHMYLEPGGRTMVNRSVVRKFGFIVAEVTEEFHRM